MYFIYSWSKTNFLKTYAINRENIEEFLQCNEEKIIDILSSSSEKPDDFIIIFIERFCEFWPDLIQHLLLCESLNLSRIRFAKKLHNDNHENINSLLQIFSKRSDIQSLTYPVSLTSSHKTGRYETDPILNAISKNKIVLSDDLVLYAYYQQENYVMHLIKSLITNTTIQEVRINYILKSIHADSKDEYYRYTLSFFAFCNLLLNHNKYLIHIIIDYHTEYYEHQEIQKRIADERVEMTGRLIRNRLNKTKRTQNFLQLVSQHLQF